MNEKAKHVSRVEKTRQERVRAMTERLRTLGYTSVRMTDNGHSVTMSAEDAAIVHDIAMCLEKEAHEHENAREREDAFPGREWYEWQCDVCRYTQSFQTPSIVSGQVSCPRMQCKGKMHHPKGERAPETAHEFASAAAKKIPEFMVALAACAPSRAESFAEAWEIMKARGYQYGEDALSGARLGWQMARGACDWERLAGSEHEKIERRMHEARRNAEAMAPGGESPGAGEARPRSHVIDAPHGTYRLERIDGTVGHVAQPAPLDTPKCTCPADPEHPYHRAGCPERR